MNFENLFEIDWKEIRKESIIHYPEVANFCGYPYRGHPKGCPNQLKCKMLNVPSFDILQSAKRFKHFYLIYLIFDFKQYKKNRRIENPDFFYTNDRLKCLLYWQGSLKKEIRKYIEEIYSINKEVFYVLGCGSGLKLSFQDTVASMEHVCINVFSTMKLNGINFEIKPRSKVILCSLLCSKKELKFKSNRK